jgi:sodium/potassium-transporting ATPase subunit alpha
LLSKPTYNPGYQQTASTYNTQITYAPGLTVFNGFFYDDPQNFMGSTNYFGNPNCTNASLIGELNTGNDYPNWLATINNKIDLRYAYVTCCPNDPTLYCSQFNNTWPHPSTLVSTISSNNGIPVIFTTEALYYAQSGYFVTIVMVQWSNVFACKSRKVPFMLFR